MRAVIDLSSGPSRKGRPRRLPLGFRDEIRFWQSHLRLWNRTQKWAATSEPVVFASDASTEGFGWVIESAPPAVAALDSMSPGSAVAGVWAGPDAPRQFSHTAIGYGELFAPVAAVLSAGAALKDTHVVFIMDNASDVAIINRRSTKAPRLLGLLKVLASASLLHNFSFTAVHRSGSENILPDVLSRPSKHGFVLDPESVNLKCLDEFEVLRSQPLAPSSSSVSSSPVNPVEVTPACLSPPHSPAFGAFFRSDFISSCASSSPLLSANSVSFCSSASLRSKFKTSAEWAEQWLL